jgi:aldose 1-epimerase
MFLKQKLDIESTTVKAEVFKHGSLQGGEDIRAFQLALSDGSSVTVSEYGCTLLSIRMPDAYEIIGETILGFPSLDGYLSDTNYIGSTVGRFANRIARGRFKLDGKEVRLSANEDEHHLHGGLRGFNRHVWRGQVVDQNGEPTLQFERTSPDGEEGYPGDLQCHITFALSDPHDLNVDITCQTNQSTIVNMTLHPYFNLDGQNQSTLDHRLQIGGNHFLPVDPGMIPTGEQSHVEGTPFDFRNFRTLGKQIAADHPQLQFAGGYDHTWSIDDADGSLREAAMVQAAESGRWLRVYTNAPGIHLYTGNHLYDGASDQSNRHPIHSGFCLEPQVWPDAPNHPDFPSAILRPDSVYRHHIRYRFGTGEVR